MIAAAVLAAGASRRLGRPKQLEAPDGECLVHRAARSALEAGFSPVLIILGHEAERVLSAVEDLPVTPVRNPAWEEGMASSVRAAVSATPPEAQGLALLVCDQVRMDPAPLRALASAFARVPDRPAACEYDGQLGVPALFPRPWFDRLATLQGDAGARLLLRTTPTTRVPWPAGSLDLDLPSCTETPCASSSSTPTKNPVPSTQP